MGSIQHFTAVPVLGEQGVGHAAKVSELRVWAANFPFTKSKFSLCISYHSRNNMKQDYITANWDIFIKIKPDDANISFVTYHLSFLPDKLLHIQLLSSALSLNMFQNAIVPQRQREEHSKSYYATAPFFLRCFTAYLLNENRQLS